MRSCGKVRSHVLLQYGRATIYNPKVVKEDAGTRLIYLNMLVEVSRSFLADSAQEADE